jgi:hypothetical protein
MIVILVLTSALILQAQETEKKLSKTDLPAVVLSAFQKAYPNAVIKGVSKEEEKGTTYYEIESVDGKTNRDLLYTIDGKAYEIEESMKAGALPKEVKTALGKEYPKAKIVKAEKVTHDSTVTYELKIKVGKKTKGITIDPQGKILKGGKNDTEKKKNKKEEKEEKD